MSSPDVDRSPSIAETTETLELLTDILIAAQEAGDRFDRNGWPYRRYCARQLENECHEMFHELELLVAGWEPTRHADR